MPPDEPVGIRRRLPCGAGSKETNREGAGSFLNGIVPSVTLLSASPSAAFAEAVRPPNPAATTAPAPIFKNFLLSIYYRINAIH